ncbi:hypothetical protein BBW65_06475 [Helicobacter enhydrae]|uniref:Tol-Pal system protein TolB n=1 Tax=Helicobacter enhydrae TaxID=222136 RepID=A0A1B1U6Y9_9HELI|nr:Tol-Pal system protein TolB [Helicobacter enhydrae]ANV98462.1 hypothetical protein BBW65_06475 [Helicobacter enhydrae]
MNKILFSCFVLCCFVFANDAKLEIVRDQKKLPNILINLATSGVEEKITKMIAKDLEVSGNFEVETQKKALDLDPSYVLYRSQKVDLLAYFLPKGQQLSLVLFDINAGKKAIEQTFDMSQKEQYPFVAHRIANAINDYLQAPNIRWMNRKVVFAKILAPSKSAIVVADYTLTYQKPIINDGLNIFPKWADAKQESIYFTKYLDQPTIIKYDLKNHRFHKILASQGIAIVSDVSADFKNLLVSMSPIGQADVYMYGVDSKKLTKLTNYPGIDVGANFMESKNQIIFISDRLGYPNVFLMNYDGSNPRQAVFHGRNNSSAASNGSYIVYSSREEKNEFGLSVFNLYIIPMEGTGIKRITLNGANQMPRFSQDGENVMFLKNSNQSALGIVRLRYNKTYLFPISGFKIQSFDW